MDQNTVIQQIINFNKASFDNTFDTLVMMQNQAEMITQTYTDQAGRISEEGKQVLSEWVHAFNKNRDEFKKTIESGFEKIESCFATETDAGKKAKSK